MEIHCKCDMKAKVLHAFSHIRLNVSRLSEMLFQMKQSQSSFAPLKASVSW